jgi:hypothetical protein
MAQGIVDDGPCRVAQAQQSGFDFRFFRFSGSVVRLPGGGNVATRTLDRTVLPPTERDEQEQVADFSAY